LRAELVFRDVPGKLLERCGHSQRFGRFGLRRRALVDSPCDGIAGVPITPVCLGFLTARRLAFRVPAGALPASHSRVRPEPPATDGARSLPGLGHRHPSSSSLSGRLVTGDQFRMPGSVLASAEAFRYNERHLTDRERFEKVLGSISGKRLTYARVKG